MTLRGRPLADIVPAGASATDDRLRELVAQGRLVAPARQRPMRPPRPVKSDRSASGMVLAEREAERSTSAALVLPQDDLLLATWDRRLHTAAKAEGLALTPETLD